MQASCQADWSQYHVSAPPPNALSKRIAISWDIPEQQLMISENCLRLTPSLLANSVKMSPDLHFSPHDCRSTRKKAVIRVSCLVIRETHWRRTGSLQKKYLSACERERP